MPFRFAVALVFVLTLSPALFAQSDKVEETKKGDEISLEDIFKGTLLAPKAFRAASKKILPSLVTIESFGGVGAVQGRIGGIRRQGEGNTTGIIISKKGYVLTSTFNFIKKPPIITVITSDGQQRLAEIAGRDQTRKICILKVKDVKGFDKLPVPEMAPLDEVNVGQWAISIGIGFGDSNPAISTGIISAKNRVGGRALQTDANISPANYGGPLIDLRGRMLGVCVPLSPRSQSLGAGVEWYDSGIGFAIPLDKSENLLTRLMEGKDIKPAWVGIQSALVETPQKGLKISNVVDKSPAAKAGLKKDDIVIKMNGKGIVDMMQFRIDLSRFNSGDKTTFVVLRDKKEVDIDVTFGEAPARAPGRPVNPKTIPKKKAAPKKAAPKKAPSKKPATPESKKSDSKKAESKKG